MFDGYFVTCDVAIALRNVGFDEPCMAVHEHYTHNSMQYTKLIIGYSNQPTTPEIYNSTIQKLLEEKPDLFKEQRRNSLLPVWQYAAPLYDQVFDWLMIKGYYLHDYPIPKLEQAPVRWGVNLYDDKGGLVWPKLTLNDQAYLYEEKREAWRYGLLAALKFLEHNKENVKHGKI